jgi:phage tail-like protein
MASIDPSQVTPRDALRGFNFRLKFESAPVAGGSGAAAAATSAAAQGLEQKYIAGVRSVTGLTWNLSSYETWSGGNNMHPFMTPNRVSWPSITLDQGIALDASIEEWAEVCRAMATGMTVAGARRTLRIDVWDPLLLGGQPDASEVETAAFSYLIYNAWVSKYTALPKLDAGTSEVALASIEIMHEGWRRTPTRSAN